MLCEHMKDNHFEFDTLFISIHSTKLCFPILKIGQSLTNYNLIFLINEDFPIIVAAN